ncbi:MULTISPECIES: YolD-like family protein [unclassified Niallia]|uniref:YolD-like family protein n=1 Tax=unclassified Niallia TaxID=2837522 RepID=UPI0009CD71D5|nr:YolD-like family protein [Niallia sp.]SLL32448.1 YolD-like protein [Mycobacteroides abscessus subsp. abscessus]HEO8419935.1 YolD-like family protein [Yersinia enterocolitica]
MILKELGRSRLIVINYYKNGFLETCKGQVQKLNLIDQTIDLKDEKENTYQIRLSWIQDICAVS